MTDTARASITPRTVVGTGLLTPILKAVAHLTVAHTAITRRNTEQNAWNADHNTVMREIVAAIGHSTDIMLTDGTPLHGLLSRNTLIQIALWRDDLQALAALPADWENMRTEVEAIVAESWTITTLLDRELTGLGAVLTDPGNQP